MTVFTTIWAFIAKIWKGLNAETKKVVPLAIHIVEGIKAFVDSPVEDFILYLIKLEIPGKADDALIDRYNQLIREWLPKIILELKLVNSVANIEEPGAQLLAILEQIKIGSDEAQRCFYHDLGVLIVEKLSDGKLSWSDSIIISEFYFKKAIQKSI